jgi:DNA-binding transcriptional LysR family regulator
MMLNAALAGFGPAYLAEDQVQSYLQSERLVQVLSEWCPYYSGHHLNRPSRRPNVQSECRKQAGTEP